MYIATCKICDAILISYDKPFTLNLWPYSMKHLVCWFCGCVHITDTEIEYKGIMEITKDNINIENLNRFVVNFEVMASCNSCILVNECASYDSNNCRTTIIYFLTENKECEK